MKRIASGNNVGCGKTNTCSCTLFFLLFFLTPVISTLKCYSEKKSRGSRNLQSTAPGLSALRSCSMRMSKMRGAEAKEFDEPLLLPFLTIILADFAAAWTSAESAAAADSLSFTQKLQYQEPFKTVAGRPAGDGKELNKQLQRLHIMRKLTAGTPQRPTPALLTTHMRVCCGPGSGGSSIKTTVAVQTIINEKRMQRLKHMLA